MMPWQNSAIMFGGVLFLVACLALVYLGTTTSRRLWGVFAQACIIAAVLRAGWPVDSKTDLGRLADSLGNRYQERFAARLEEKLNAIHVNSR